MVPILVFASGTKTGGGSGFCKLFEASRSDGPLKAEIVGVVSNHPEGGVYHLAERLGVPFIHFPGPWTGEKYQRIARDSGADFFALSGWLKLVLGLHESTVFNSKTVFNIHPGPLPKFGGSGLYGHHVHKAVMRAYRKGKVGHSAVTMHFVTENYDEGPVFFELKVPIHEDDTPESLWSRLNALEHQFQPEITNLVVNGKIRWNGHDKESLVLPTGYQIRRTA